MDRSRPNLYQSAATVIELAKKKKGNLKSLCFQSSYSNKKKLYALVCQAVKHKKNICTLLNKLKIDETECKIDECLRLVLAYEIVLGKGVKSDGEIGNFVTKYGESLTEEWLKLEESGDTQNNSQGVQVILPRYVRVNTLKTDVNQVIESFKEEGFTFISDKSGDLDEQSFSPDTDIPEVLVFGPGTDFHRHELYKNGHILLQDKASCLPAYLLHPKSKSTVIDACAAPGNKTTHLASIMKNRGKIFAFDLDAKRLKLLKDQLKKAGAENVDAQHQDFLKTNPSDEQFRKVKYILLDPSCSGSGMVSRMDDYLDEPSENKEKLKKRLEALSKFQYAMLCHALSFPNVKKVCYSTCSVHQEENEDVVERCLLRFGKKFSLVNLLPSWKNRGFPSFEEGFKCLRASPEDDHTNGFFVAMFKRTKDSEHTEENTIEPNTRDSEKHQEEVQKKSKKKRKRDHSKSENETGDVERKREGDTVMTKQEIKKKNFYENAKKRRKMIRKPVTS